MDKRNGLQRELGKQDTLIGRTLDPAHCISKSEEALTSIEHYSQQRGEVPCGRGRNFENLPEATGQCKLKAISLS